MRANSLPDAQPATRPAVAASATEKVVAVKAAAASFSKVQVVSAAAEAEAAATKPSHAVLAPPAAMAATHAVRVKEGKKSKTSQLSVMFGLIGRDVEMVGSGVKRIRDVQIRDGGEDALLPGKLLLPAPFGARAGRGTHGRPFDL